MAAVADRQAADGSSDADRYCSSSDGETLQHVGDIVEPVALVVGRKKRRDVDFQVEQIADRVAVFGRDSTGASRHGRVRGETRGAIERCFQRGRELSTVAWSGRGMPCGGIMPPCILRTTFSQVSAPSPMCSTSILSSVSPPVFSLSLWQVTQYLSSSARSAAGAKVAAGAGPADC